MQAIASFVSRAMRATTFVLKDKRIPRPFRWAGGLGLLPIPGPLDEIALLFVAVPLLVFYRGTMREAWRAARRADGF